MPGYFEFEVSLLHAEPRIWRRFPLRKAATFQDLHTEDCGSYDEADGVDLRRWMGDWDPERFDQMAVKKKFDR